MNCLIAKIDQVAPGDGTYMLRVLEGGKEVYRENRLIPSVQTLINLTIGVWEDMVELEREYVLIPKELYAVLMKELGMQS